MGADRAVRHAQARAPRRRAHRGARDRLAAGAARRPGHRARAGDLPEPPRRRPGRGRRADHPRQAARDEPALSGGALGAAGLRSHRLRPQHRSGHLRSLGGRRGARPPRQAGPRPRVRHVFDGAPLRGARRGGADRGAPGEEPALGYLQHRLGHARSARPFPEAGLRRRLGQPSGRPRPDRAGRPGRVGHRVRGARGGLVPLADSGGDDPRHRRARELRASARALRLVGRGGGRQCRRRRVHARDRPGALEAPRPAQALGADRVVARPFDRPLRRQHLVRRPLRGRALRALHRAGQLRLARLPLGHRVSRRRLDAGGGGVGEGRDPRGHRQGGEGRAPLPGGRLLVQQHRDLVLFHAAEHHAAGAPRREGLLHRRRLRGEHRLAHRGGHPRDRRPAGPPHRHEDLSRRGGRGRERDDRAVRFRADGRGVFPDAGGLPGRGRPGAPLRRLPCRPGRAGRGAPGVRPALRVAQ